MAYAREHKRVMLSTDGSEHKVIVYTVIAREPSEVAPSRGYLNRLIAAAEHRGLPEAYVATVAQAGRGRLAPDRAGEARRLRTEDGPAGSSAG